MSSTPVRDSQANYAAGLSMTAGDPLFDGPGEMRERCRELDWSATPLGTSSDWQLSLRNTVSILLASSFPMFLWYGPHLVQIYNDAYRPSFGNGGRNERALGAQGVSFWTEIWAIIGPQIQQVMDGGPATFHEDQLVPIERNGHIEDVFWTYSFNPAFDDRGGVAGVLVVCQETTARVNSAAEREQFVQAERRARADADAARETMRRVFAQAPVGVAVLEGRELRYTAANSKYRQLIGDRDPVGLSLTEMFPELIGSEAERVLHAVYDSGHPFLANDFVVRYDAEGTGEPKDNYYDLTYQPLTDENSAVTGIVVVAIDVTGRNNIIRERTALLATADRAVKDADRANKAKSDFLAVMSHELRTPLNAIAGYAELLELEVHGPVTAEQRVALGRIQRSQRHLLGLINGVLNFVKVDAGSVNYEIVDVMLNDVLSTCEALIAPQMTAKHLNFHCDGCAPHLSALADAEKVQQVVLNLLSNAMKFTDPFGEVRMTCQANEKNVVIEVSDTGRGIPEGQLERVFLPFVQLDVSLTRTQEGTGLGLAISRDLARGMKGELTASSTYGVGSTFTLTLPRATIVAAPLSSSAA